MLEVVNEEKWLAGRHGASRNTKMFCLDWRLEDDFSGKGTNFTHLEDL